MKSHQFFTITVCPKAQDYDRKLLDLFSKDNSVYYHIRQRKAANPHRWEWEQVNILQFCLRNSYNDQSVKIISIYLKRIVLTVIHLYQFKSWNGKHWFSNSASLSLRDRMMEGWFKGSNSLDTYVQSYSKVLIYSISLNNMFWSRARKWHIINYKVVMESIFFVSMWCMSHPVRRVRKSVEHHALPPALWPSKHNHIVLMGLSRFAVAAALTKNIPHRDNVSRTDNVLFKYDGRGVSIPIVKWKRRFP